MTRSVRVRSINRKELDRDKLALALLLLAKIMAEQEEAADGVSNDEAQS